MIYSMFSNLEHDLAKYKEERLMLNITPIKYQKT